MNQKAQLGVGVIVTIAIAVIVGLVMFQPIASNVDLGTRAASGSIASGAAYNVVGVLNTPVELRGQELVSVTSVKNQSGGGTVAAANYTIAECVRSSDGLKGICYTALAAGVGNPATGAVNISYTYYPDGYIDDAGARSVSGIIILLSAIAIALIVLVGIKKDFF